jgi:hypothetical protein
MCRPLLDFFLLLLFLPSLLTLLTVFTQRLRVIRQQKLDRAPRDAVAKLPVFLWGDTEKAPTSVVVEGVEDEERSIGHVEVPTESTSLLPSSSTTRPASGRWTIGGLVKQWRKREKSSTLAPRRERKFQTTECAICLSDFELGDKVSLGLLSHVH